VSYTLLLEEWMKTNPWIGWWLVLGFIEDLANEENQ